jgi:hypothetical protein
MVEERRCRAGVEERPGKIKRGAGSHVGTGQVGHGEVMRQELDSLRDAGSIGSGVDDLIAAVVFHGRANIPTFFAVWVPGGAVSGRFENNDLTPGGSEGGAVEIKLAEDLGLGGEPGVEARSAQEVQREFRLGQ